MPPTARPSTARTNASTCWREEYGEIFRNRASFGGLIRVRDYVQALRHRRELCQEMAGAMADPDLLVDAS